ncbi:hypothetical protein BDZ91DRAFT_439110 [Kalaharituber pfeilii]|nr:hypothetical protein BDZ91DRAFT_439110 [Kalaharituber pfeilii]
MIFAYYDKRGCKRCIRNKSCPCIRNLMGTFIDEYHEQMTRCRLFISSRSDSHALAYLMIFLLLASLNCDWVMGLFSFFSQLCFPCFFPIGFTAAFYDIHLLKKRKKKEKKKNVQAALLSSAAFSDPIANCQRSKRIRYCMYPEYASPL